MALLQKGRAAVLSGLLVVVLVGTFLSTRAPQPFTMLVRMTDKQHDWFYRRLADRLADFDQPLKLEMVEYETTEELRRRLEEARRQGVAIDLVKLEIEMLAPLQKYMIPLDQFENTGLKDFLEPATSIARLTDPKRPERERLYYLPRKLETNLMFYRKSKVQEAVVNWGIVKTEIQQAFTEAGHPGLPHRYVLEPEPEKWDWYDLAVVSYYWWATESAKMAHRGRRYPGTMTEIATKIFQARGSRNGLLFQGDDTDWAAIRDAFQWEAFFRGNGLYVREMWDERWDGTDLWKAIAADRVYLCFLHQLDFRRLLDEQDAILDKHRRKDIGVAQMPAGASLELDETGQPERVGGHVSQISGWWWGIPEKAVDKQRSWKVAHVITGRQFHEEEVYEFGILPIRLDVLLKKAKSNNGFLGEVWDQSWSQMGFEFGTDVSAWNPQGRASWIPHHPSWPTIQRLWLDAWDRVVIQSEDVDESLCTLCRQVKGVLRDDPRPCRC